MIYISLKVRLYSQILVNLRNNNPVLDKKLSYNPYICEVLLSFDKDLDHVKGAELSQNFFDSLPPDTFEAIYVSRSKTQFRESFQDNRSGGFYSQQVVISMPRSEYDRSTKIKKLISARYVFLKLSNGSVLVIGRNDHKQNKKLNCEYTSNEQLAQFQYTCRSIFSAGFLQLDGAGFPYQIPTQTP